MEEMKEWCRLMPKIELHAHLNGSIRDSTLLELAKVLGEKGVIVFDDVKDVIMKCGRSLPECFQLFDLYHILATDHETVSRITKETIEDFAAENVVYLELRTTPKNNQAKGMTKRSYMKAVIDGLRDVDTVDVSFISSDILINHTSEKKKRIFVRLLLSIDRRETTEAAMETVCSLLLLLFTYLFIFKYFEVNHTIPSHFQVDLAVEMKDLGVVGIDLSGNPIVGEWKTFLPALMYAKDKGLPITLHCGEVPNPEEIQAMLDICPERLGHACFLQDEEWQRVKSSRIPVEICLTSNLQTERLTSIDYHHFDDLYKAKHPVVICTDDRGLFSTTLSNEYYLAASTFGLAKGQMIELARSAIDFVFADDGVKKNIRELFEASERAY
ncbi:LOW QUALITY PROTEIN: adenosine deaminase-like protein [Asparagus officinalis]|uniref:LOW QUALITY PROTEIN: adenosine deaminase-like protein n=1 Tax=Asparagus officinalis TaxID=4686 RepID=UPI00098E1EED|nr:LOW QUALITY PROTEIN: adenosine deaminase-like protein [Asparagus officinalis]